MMAPLRVPLDNLLPDAVDDESEVDHSFHHLRQKTRNLLYGSSHDRDDKSPKGSVDERIRPLVDLINHHPSFTSLSSCSGRISLFDPNKTSTQMFVQASGESRKIEQLSKANASKEIDSGKGVGGWKLVTHDPLDDPEPLLQCLACPSSYETSDQPFSHEPFVFKMEPMLLHIGASNIDRGKQLLQVALGAGFRESGLVATAHRVTVAIRGYSLALTVPLSISGPLRPSDQYIRSIVELANERLAKNQANIEKLYNSIQDALFVTSFDVPCERLVLDVHITQELPGLNLWGAGVVCIESKSTTDIYSFGGYGEGPRVQNQKESMLPSRRHSEVYRLSRRQGRWEECWTLVETRRLEFVPDFLSGMQLTPCDFPACQGCRACLFHITSGQPIIILWGGRKGPRDALNVLYLFDISHQSFFRVHSSSPPPLGRWGHTLTSIPLVNDDSEIKFRAIVAGGCNSTGIIPQEEMVYVLSLAFDGIHLQWIWERCACKGVHPRFHHESLLPHQQPSRYDQSVTLLLAGGLQSTDELASTPRSTELDDQLLEIGFAMGEPACLVTTKNIRSNISAFGFGLCNVVPSEEELGLIPLALAAGGISTETENCDTLLRCFRVAPTSADVEDGKLYQMREIVVNLEGADQIDGCMVHHSCIALSSCSDIVVLGGGCMTFAFGDSFAGSFAASTSLRFHSRGHSKSIASRVGRPYRQHPVGQARQKVHASVDKIVTRVLKCHPRNAKLLKTALEQDGYLDRRYRMIKMDEKVVAIAVPVTLKGTYEDHDWSTFVLGDCDWPMPLSTAQFASRKKPTGIPK